MADCCEPEPTLAPHGGPRMLTGGAKQAQWARRTEHPFGLERWTSTDCSRSCCLLRQDSSVSRFAWREFIGASTVRYLHSPIKSDHGHSSRHEAPSQVTAVTTSLQHHSPFRLYLNALCPPLGMSLRFHPPKPCTHFQLFEWRHCAQCSKYSRTNSGTPCLVAS